MPNLPIYMDSHATTRVDPRVVQAMLPYFTEQFGNPGSINHSFGTEAKEAVDRARLEIANAIGADEQEVIFTSGSTEGNNLAIRGVALRKRRRGNHLISVLTEHPSVLAPLERLQNEAFDVTLLHVSPYTDRRAGWLDPQQVREAIRPSTCLVSVMLANNEIGVLQSIQEIASICHEHEVFVHCDATQAVGKIPVDVHQLGVDLLSFSAHKFHGPKGIGGLVVRRNPRLRLTPIIDGGRQERGLRSGTLNVPGIVGMATALKICTDEMPGEDKRLRFLRDKLAKGIMQQVERVSLNGPILDEPAWRLANNLNLSFHDVDGEALMMSIRNLAVSSGSACTSANPEPSHVLRALGLSDDLTRASLRFGLGRFNDEAEVDFAIGAISEAVTSLRKLGASS